MAAKQHGKSALVIVDVQNDFISGSLANPYNGAEIIPIINWMRDKFDVVVISCDWHPASHCSFVESANAKEVAIKDPRDTYDAFSMVTLLADKDRPEHQQMLYPRHAVQNTEGSKCHADLVVKDSDLRVYKGTRANIDSYSAFFDNMKANDTGLTDMLEKAGVTDVYCCGLVTDICVKATALHAAEGGFQVTVIEDASKPLSMDNMAATKEELAAAGVALMTAVEAVASAADLKHKSSLEYMEAIKTSVDANVVDVVSEGEYPEFCTIVVKPGEALEPEAEVPVLVSVRTPQGTTRTPSDICCVLDVSGSMGTEATIMDASGTKETHGLSLLDVAKHGVRTIIKTCSSADRLTLVTFNNTATTVLPLTVMDEAGQKRAEEQLEMVQAGGGTEIWNGLFAGLEALRTGVADGRLAHVMLLTDGESREKEKIVPNLLQYKETYERLPGTISTFGFGYNIDSSLLVRLASAGDGSYSFIPDAGFVGTVFVNTLSNLLVTMAREVYLSLEAEEGAEILSISGDYKLQDAASSGMRVNLGTLQYEQTKDVIVFMRVAGRQPYLTVSGSYEGVGGVVGTMPMAEGTLDEDKMEVGVNVCRSRYVDVVQQVARGLQQASLSLEAAQSLLADAAAFIEQSAAAACPQVAALLEDLKGQTTEAISKQDCYRKWGRHYVPSVMFAHNLQQCNNFKDPGVQVYGGPLFQDVRDTSDDIFNTLPAPKPSIRRASQVARAPPASMAAYNCRYGGCIDGSCQVLLASGEARLVRDLKLGDVVESLGSMPAEIVCLVRTPCRGGRADLVELPGGARLTPYHPVLHDGSWVFPIDLAEVSEQPCDAVYNLVLRGAAAIVVAGVPCIALGHGIEEGSAKHPYFGQQQAIEDVAKLPGFEDGLVHLSPGWEVRDEVTGLVCGMRQDVDP